MQLSSGFHLGQGFSANFEFYIPTMQHSSNNFNNSLNYSKLSKQNNRNINLQTAQQQQQQIQQQQIQQHQFQQISSSPPLLQVTTENVPIELNSSE